MKTLIYWMTKTLLFILEVIAVVFMFAIALNIILVLMPVFILIRSIDFLVCKLYTNIKRQRRRLRK